MKEALRVMEQALEALEECQHKTESGVNGYLKRIQAITELRLFISNIEETVYYDELERGYSKDRI